MDPRDPAADHGFGLATATRLGGLPGVLATLITDASMLPVSRSLAARIKVGVLRIAAAAMVRVLDARRLSRGVAINSNCYLGNAVVLRAR